MRGQPMNYLDFGGGLNSKGAPYLLEDSQARDLLNVQSLTQGGIVKRDGLSTFATPAVALTSLFALEATGTPFLIGAGATSLYKVTTGGVASAIKTGLTNGARWEWAQAQASGGQGPLYGMNGADTPQQWDGVAATTSNWTAATGSVPNGKYIITHQNYVFVAGVAANPSRLYWCSVAAATGTDPRTWPVANVIDLDPNDGDQITGLGKVGNLLLVFKRRKTFAVFDPTTGANRRISDSVGCVANRSVAESPGGTFFLAEDGVYRTNGSNVELVSDRVTPTLRLLASLNACGTFWRNHYYLSFPSSGNTLDYDTQLTSWWLHSISSNQFAIWHPSAVGLYSAKSSAAIVDQCFVPGVSQDNGTNYVWYWKGPWLSPSFYRRRRMPTPYYHKRLRGIRCDGSGTVDCSVAVDFLGAETLLANNVFLADAGATFGGAGNFGDAGATFGGGPTVPLAQIPVGNAVARAFSPVFGATSPNPGAVYSMTLLITDRKN